MIRIHCTKQGFRRVGLAHPAVADYPEGHFSDAQLAILRAEPMLLVEIVAEDSTEAPEQPEAKNQKKQGK